MPIKIVAEDKVVLVGTFITRRVIVNMVQEFVNNTFKKQPGNPPRKVTHNNDSHAVYYSKNEVDQLFADNGCTIANNSHYGLRVYIGFHENNELQNGTLHRRPSTYIGNHTVVLVCTYDKTDMLNPGDSVSVLMVDGAGQGVEEGEICPPPTCGGVDGDLNP